MNITVQQIEKENLKNCLFREEKLSSKRFTGQQTIWSMSDEVRSDGGYELGTI